jgi:hypothetical protein
MTEIVVSGSIRASEARGVGSIPTSPIRQDVAQIGQSAPNWGEVAGSNPVVVMKECNRM